MDGLCFRTGPDWYTDGADPGEGLPEVPWGAPHCLPNLGPPTSQTPLWLQGLVAKPLLFAWRHSPPCSQPAQVPPAPGGLAGLAHLEFTFPSCCPGGVSGRWHCDNQLQMITRHVPATSKRWEHCDWDCLSLPFPTHWHGALFVSHWFIEHLLCATHGALGPGTDKAQPQSWGCSQSNQEGE